MLQTILEQSIFMYVIAAAGLIGIVARLIVNGCLKSLVKETNKMGSTRKKTLVEIRKRYEDITSLNVEIRDMNSFVGKYIERLKIGKISVKGWNNFIKNMLILIAGTGIIGSLYQYDVTGSPNDSMAILIFGSGTFCLLLMTWNLFDCQSKLRMLDYGIQNYLTNSLANRLHREEMKQAAVTDFREVPEKAEEKKREKRPERTRCRSRDQEEAEVAATQVEMSDELFERLLEGIISEGM